MKKHFLATVITFASFVVPAHASNMTGDALALACEGNVPNMKREKNTDDYVKLCNAYINGWDDARFAFLQGTTTYCPPKITAKEMSVVFFDYMATHREAKDLPAAEALMLAFKHKWPCHRTENSGAKSPEQACQAQALASIAREWPGVLKGQFEVILKDNRCLVFLQANSTMYEGKRAAWLIDGKTGDLLSEFYAPTTGAGWKDSDRGHCSYRGGKFPTSECSWSEYMDKADQM